MNNIKDIAGNILTEFAEYSYWSKYYDEVYLSKVIPEADYKALEETLVKLKKIMFRMIEVYQHDDFISVENVPYGGFTLHHLSNKNTPTSELKKDRYPFYQLIARLEKEGKFNPEDKLDLVLHPNFFDIVDDQGNLVDAENAPQRLSIDINDFTNKNKSEGMD